MNIRIMSITAFSIMFLSVATMPFHVAMLICFCVFTLLLSIIAVFFLPKINEGNKDIYPEEFTSIDDVPVVKIDEHC